MTKADSLVEAQCLEKNFVISWLMAIGKSPALLFHFFELLLLVAKFVLPNLESRMNLQD